MSGKQKYYINRDYLRMFLISAGCLAFILCSDSLLFPRHGGPGIIAWFFTIMCVAGCGAFLYGMWKFRYTKELPVLKPESIVIEFEAASILFPKGYHFSQSSVHSTKQLNAEDITEVNLRTTPPSVVLHDAEVIFLKSGMEDLLRDFAERNKLRLSERYDIWGGINEPFVDTELSFGMRKQVLRNLKENGITVKELRSIRKRICLTMFLGNYYAMDWVYLGQFDYLRWTLRTEKKYWWSMEIALRNYRNT